MYNLKQLGFDHFFRAYIDIPEYSSYNIGRISAEHKERYWIISEEGELEGEITGNMRFTASSRNDFPAVGDWVTYTTYEDNKVIIHHILPRKTILERQAIGRQGESQIIATNIDTAFIVMGVDRDFNLNRAERYIALSKAAKVEPILVCNKSDLLSASEITNLLSKLKQRLSNITVVAINCLNEANISPLKEYLAPSKTYCLLGSSGVGKSSILNLLSGQKQMLTSHISNSNQKGRHTTTHRELFVMPQGGIIIDNPGMREVGVTDTADGIEQTFDQITDLTKACKFKNCTHTTEKGCAIIKAVDDGQLSIESYQNFLKLERERKHYQSSVAEKRTKDKAFGKMIKNYKNTKRKPKE